MLPVSPACIAQHVQVLLLVAAALAHGQMYVQFDAFAQAKFALRAGDIGLFRIGT